MIYDPNLCVSFTPCAFHWITFALRPKVVASMPAWMPLLYDSIVIALTLYYILPKERDRRGSTLDRKESTQFRSAYIIRRLLEDGVLYYGYVSINLTDLNA
jgi:hypothetical protein